jgi:hypothetical protein
MKAIGLGYHDIVDQAAQSGRSRQDLLYKLDREDFRDHVQCIQDQNPAVAVQKIDRKRQWSHVLPVFITFDDGALSSYTVVAEELERFGWRGHFFITTDWIGRKGFLDPALIRELHSRGHVIGSHTCSHPSRMSSLKWDQLLREWGVSCQILGDIIGQEVKVASVADGFYSKTVGKAASASGIEVLFTSEATSSVNLVDSCMILGRYMIQRQMAPITSGAIAANHKWPRWQQTVAWQAKKPLKALTGEFYFSIRRALLSRGV